jgi:hypothetical protein
MRSRVQVTAAATLEHVFEVGETPTDSSTPVTVTVTDANGQAVADGTATTAGAGTGRYTFALAGQPQLQLLTVAWSGTIAGAAVVETDLVDIVGGRLFTLSEGRKSDPSLADTSKYPTADLEQARLETEEECEEICDRAWTPRYRRAVLDGTGHEDLLLPDTDIRTIRAASIAPRYGQAPVALTSGQLAALAVTADGSLRRTNGALWTEGIRNIVLEYEYGADAPPRELVKAALIRFRSRLNLFRSGIPDRAVSWSAEGGGGTYRIALPSEWRTGIPEVDAAYSRYSRRAQGGADGAGGDVPASRTLDYNPQRYSLFHGGRR